MIQCADDDAIRAFEIADCGAFPKKFGVRDNGKLYSGPRRAGDPLDFVTGSDGNGRFRDNNGFRMGKSGDFLGCRVDKGQIRVPVATARRCTDGDENGLRVTCCFRQIGGEAKPSFFDVFCD